MLGVIESYVTVDRIRHGIFLPLHNDTEPFDHIY